MSTSPDIQQPRVRNALRQAYGLSVERLTFLTTGWVSLCYRVEATGKSYLLKLYDKAIPAPLVASSLDFYLPLSYQLCTQGLLPQIARPVPALDGRFAVHAGPYLLILFHFIEGEPLGFGNLPDDIVPQLAGLVGRLHRNTRGLEFAHPLIERFEIAFEDVLPAGLDKLANLGLGERPNLHAFRDLMLSHRAAIRGHLDRLKALQGIVRTRAHDMVVCHTDLHGKNLLVSQQGDLYILDWEGAIVSPPEQDLFFFAGEDTFWDLFWPNYTREFGLAQLDVDTLGFYYYRRGLEDLADWVQRFLCGDQDDEHERSSLHWAAETLAGLPTVETTLGKIRAQLNKTP